MTNPQNTVSITITVTAPKFAVGDSVRCVQGLYRVGTVGVVTSRAIDDIGMITEDGTVSGSDWCYWLSVNGKEDIHAFWETQLTRTDK